MNARILVALTALAAMAMLSACKPPTCKEPKRPKLAAGLQVLANIEGERWTPAKISSLKGRTIEVVDAVGVKANLSADDFVVAPKVLYRDAELPCCFKLGDKVLAKYGDGSWRIATLTAIDGDAAQLVFQNFTKGTSTLMNLVRAPR